MSTVTTQVVPPGRDPASGPPILALARPDAPASLKALQRSLDLRRVDWTDDHDTNPFANINTLADLVALQRHTMR